MTKSELIEKIASVQHQLSAKDVELAVKMMLDQMAIDLESEREAANENLQEKQGQFHGESVAGCPLVAVVTGDDLRLLVGGPEQLPQGLCHLCCNSLQECRLSSAGDSNTEETLTLQHTSLRLVGGQCTPVQASLFEGPFTSG